MAGAVTVIAAVLLIAGCGGARPSKYYTLDLPGGDATGGSASAAKYDVSLLVGRLSTPHVYRDSRIVHRSAGTEMGAYEYHRWAEPPTDMLEAMLVRKLRADGKYSSVQAQSSNARGDYILRGRLHELGEVAGGSTGVAARVALEMELYERSSGNNVWTHFYRQDEPVNGKEVPAVVEAMNRNAQRAIEQIAAGLEQHFAKNRK